MDKFLESKADMDPPDDEDVSKCLSTSASNELSRGNGDPTTAFFAWGQVTRAMVGSGHFRVTVSRRAP